MLKFFIKRLVRAAITLCLVLVFVFFGARVTGNPFEALYPEGLNQESLEAFNQQFGFDQPLHVQFRMYLQNLVTGDFGDSIAQREPVDQIFAEKFPITMRLGVCALTVSVVFGVMIGLFCALYPRHPATKVLMLLVSACYALPGFIIAIGLVLLFSYTLHWLPSQGGSGALGYVMPVIVLSAQPISSIARYVRSSLLEVISQEYIKTAVAKGMGRSHTVYVHALKNALIPVVTIIGMVITSIFTGSMVVETVFSWKGVGKTLVDAVLNRDFPMIQYGVLCIAVMIIVVNLAVDLVYMVIDPRIRIEG